MTPAKKVSKLQEVEGLIDDYDVIAVDEGQFFPDVSSIMRSLNLKSLSWLIQSTGGPI